MPPLALGTRIPDFTLTAGDGSVVRARDLRGAPLVLWFYPEDGSEGCSRQACDLRDAWDQFNRAGVRVIGISPDDVASHQRFSEELALPFPLLADPGHQVADAFGVWGEKVMFGHRYEGLLRTTFLIDADGTIRHVFPRVQPGRHATLVLRELWRCQPQEAA